MFSKKTINKIMALTGSVLMTGLIISSGIKPVTVNADTKNVKKVIYLIADGMSTSTMTSARYYKDYQDGILGNDKLSLDAIQTGYVRTSWENGPITDSAPAGTALSTGFKTNNAHIGVTPDKKPIATILEAAELSGLSTGIIATSEIMHATPAAFSSHDSARSNYNSIMKQQVYQDMEVVFGGGDEFFGPTGGGKRNDGKDLTKEIKELGYEYITTRDQLEASDSGKLWGMFADRDLAYEADREEFNNSQPSLSDMTSKAIEVLNKNEDGFFLMVEGSKIDWAAHANDPIGAITDTLEFDEAVKVALDFAKSNEDTIVVVTTDHANSGLSIGNSDTSSGYDNLTYEDSVLNLKDGKISQEQFNKIIEGKYDTEIQELITKYHGFNNVSEEEVNLAKEGKINEVVAKRCKIGYTTDGHTGGDVYLGIYAPKGVEKLSGTVENTELPKYIEANMGLNLEEATKALFNNVKEELESKGASFTINEDDKENPYAVSSKGDVELKIFANTNKVEVKKVNDVKTHELNGVVVYNGSDFYSTKEVGEILELALEDNSGSNGGNNNGGGNGGNNSGNNSSTNKPSGGNSNSSSNSSGKLPYTGAVVGTGMILLIGAASTVLGAKYYKKK
ncbi:alkaline phosphatase [Clostridium sp.]|uniref:alkaline phosphatase n=1 Tax=Clostridium sp. TaxID=1506 RepID=UPI003F30DEF3